MQKTNFKIQAKCSRFLAYVVCCFFFLFFSINAGAQDYEDSVYDPDVTSVTFHLAGSPLSMPLINLDAGDGLLVLGFDQLINEISDFSYTVIHCDQDWKPSELRVTEYLSAFQDDRIKKYETGFNTLTNYVHYELALPNQQIRWTKSGNYVLKVWYEYDTKKVVLTRRFMVVDPKWRIDVKQVPAVKVSKRDTHHEFDFSIVTTKTRITNPRNDIRAYVLQNGNWATMIGPVMPFASIGEAVSFDYQDSIIFPAGKEFRYFDTRNLDIKGYRIAELSRTLDGWDAFVNMDENEAYKPYSFWADINGNFVNEYTNTVQSIGIAGSRNAVVEVSPEQTRLKNLSRCDYALMFFTFQAKRPFEDQDLYLFGKFTDWKIQKQYKMTFQEEHKAYFGEAFLKQGFYNYRYALVNRETGAIDVDGVEGNWYETNNQYTFLAYFRPFGARYDQLLGAVSVNSDVFRN